MNCPELTSLTKVAGDSAEPELSRHLQECAACRRDLEIASAVRELLYPDAEVPARLNARVMARVRTRAERLMGRASALDLFVSAILGGAGAYAAFVAAGGGGFLAPSLAGGIFTATGAVVGAWYHRWRSGRERARVDQRILGGPTGLSFRSR